MPLVPIILIVQTTHHLDNPIKDPSDGISVFAKFK